MKLGTPRVTAVMLLIAFAALIVGCGPKYDGPKRAAVKGTVKLDGQPVDGVIYFEPQGELRRASADIVGGEFSLSEELGPNLGTYTIRITWDKPTGERGPEGDIQTIQSMPAKYFSRSELTAEIVAGQNVLDYSNLTTN